MESKGVNRLTHSVALVIMGAWRKVESCNDANFVITGCNDANFGITECSDANFGGPQVVLWQDNWCHNWWQSGYHEDSRFLVVVQRNKKKDKQKNNNKKTKTMRHGLVFPLVWLASLNIHWVFMNLHWILRKLQCIVGSYSQWEFLLFSKGDRQSLRGMCFEKKMHKITCYNGTWM